MKAKIKDNIFLILSLILMFGSRFLPPTESLSSEALNVIGIFFGSLLMWITISIDWPSMITLIALGLVNSIGFSKTFSGAFGNSTVAFLLFTFALVYPLSKTNFVRRCTIAFITNKFAVKSSWHFIIFLFSAVTFMGLFISPSVLFIAFLPFLEDIYDVMNIPKGSKVGNMMMMGTAICISLSSGMTAIGHVWPTLAIGAYKAATGNDINQFQYMAFGIPTGIILLIYLILVFRFIYIKSELKLDTSNALVFKDHMPEMDKTEKTILITLGIVVGLWVIPSFIKGIAPDVYKIINGWTTAMPPLLGCIILSITKDKNDKRIMNFKEVTTKGILWSAILMTGAATWLGSCLTNADIGISNWLTDSLSPIANNMNTGLLVFFFVAWAVIETNFSSNIVTTTVVSAVALSVTTALPAGSINIPGLICLIGFSAAICNMTPAGQSTINTVAISSGYTDTKSMFIYGGIFAIISIIAISTFGYVLTNFIF